MQSSIELFQLEMDEMSKQFPFAALPPNCYRWMQVKELAYESRTMLSIEIVVSQDMLNPMHMMQGGFISAAFDNAIGPLSYVAARKACVTMDMHTQYIRSISAGESLIITARVISRGPVSLHISGEALNSKGKLVATCSANMIVMK